MSTAPASRNTLSSLPPEIKANQIQTTTGTSKAESSYCSTTCCKEDRAASITLIAMTAITLIGVIFLISILQADTGNMTAFFSKVRSVVHHLATNLETSPLNVSLFIVVMGGMGFVGALIWRAKVCCDEPQIPPGSSRFNLDGDGEKPSTSKSQAAGTAQPPGNTLDPNQMSPGQTPQGQASAAGTPQSQRASIAGTPAAVPAAPPMEGDTLHPNEQPPLGTQGSPAAVTPVASPLQSQGQPPQKPQGPQGSAPTTPASPSAATVTPIVPIVLAPGASLSQGQVSAMKAAGQSLGVNPLAAAVLAAKQRKSAQGAGGSVVSKPSLSASANLGGSAVLDGSAVIVPSDPERKEGQENL